MNSSVAVESANVRQPEKPPTLTRDDLDAGSDDHHQRERERPRRRRLHEDELQDDADERQLHQHARGGDGDALLQAEAEAPGDGAVGDEQGSGQGDVERCQCHVGHGAPTALPFAGVAGFRQDEACMRQTLDLRAVVADEHHAMPRQHLEADQFLDERRRLRIEGARGLVEQQHFRIIEQRAHEREALAFAGRQRGDWAIEKCGVEVERLHEPIEPRRR